MTGQQTDRVPAHTGGCQCGAVRFAVYMQLKKIGLCHCRMCQKATGAPFSVLAEVAWGDFAWTRGSPAHFRSSSRSARDFCAACGTPLSYREVGGAIIELMTGTFDRPRDVVPTYEVGTESKLEWLARMSDFPGKSTAQNTGAVKLATIVSYQHPDHDTEAGWKTNQVGSRERAP